MNTMEMKVADLKQHPKNEEIYGVNEDISDLVEKIKKSGRVHTMTVNSKGVVLAGHRRLKACIELGIETVNVEIVDFDTPEEEVEFIILDNHQREKTIEQKAKEARTLKEVESRLALIRKSKNGGDRKSEKYKSHVPDSAPLIGEKRGVPDSAQGLEGEKKGKARDFVAKKVGLRSGHEVDRAITAVNKIEELKKAGRVEDAELIRGVLNNRSVSAAEELARNIDIVKIPEKEKPLIQSGKKSSYFYVEQAKQKQRPKEETKTCKTCGKELPVKMFHKGGDKCKDCCSERSQKKTTEYIGNTTLTMEDLEETVREYNAQSRGEIEIVIPEREKGYVSKTYEDAMTEFRRKTAQCMTHQREIQKMDTEEKIRLGRIMKKFIEDFEKDRIYITGGK